jgi:triphosphatase
MVSSAQQEAASPASTAKGSIASVRETAREFLMAAFAELIKDHSSASTSFGKSQTEADVHALRIAARKLRCAIALINHIEPSSRLQALAQDVKATANSLAKLRELDVLIRQVNAFEWPSSHAAAARQLIEALSQSRNAVASLSTANTNARTQHHSKRDFAAAEFDRPARDVAEELLDHLLRRTSKKARKIKTFSDHQRHDLRIAIKNLRYGIELFSPLYDDNKNFHRYLKRTSKLQVELGTCNDAASARTLLSENAPLLQPDVQEAAECFLKTLEKQARKAANALPKRWYRLQQQEPFWQ